jgi:CRP-like cAMP-binding protein
MPSATNALLALLPLEERTRILPLLEKVTIDRGTTLHDMGARVTSNYFPASGIVSLVSMTMEGQTLEVAAIGSDGVVGIETVLQVGIARWEAVASTPVEALRISADRLRSELERSAALRRALLQYSYGVLGQVAQAAVCHRFHTVAQRLARWLLVARERLRSDAIQMTQEAVAGCSGVRGQR